jgi:hypothetical protein
MLATMRPHLLTLAAAALLAGCGADSSVSTTTTPVTLDEVFKEMSLPAISGATNAAARLDMNMVTEGTIVPTGCAYAVASQSFVCAPVTASGVTYTQSYQLLNGSGGALALFEPTSVAAVRMQSTISGTETSVDGTFTINGWQDQTLSGLQTSKHVLNGTSVLTMGGTFRDTTLGTAPFTMTMKSTTTNLVIPAHGGPKTYPASGTIAVDETMSLRSLPAFTTRIILTFDGTSKVKVTIDGVAVSGCSTIDLSTTNPGCS